ncbi:CHRD domain-containing protein [Flavisolibacter nicotianae]|uniref:CHRD domain-containing protein n=1 Tax=Flavisolibacter nicotianae TaxID=2364882 RepID=UPI0013C4DE36|nr:CHRD domain-containing protein [Flavisolibacter nicotianae]
MKKSYLPNVLLHKTVLSFFTGLFLLSFSARANNYWFSSTYSGANEVPPNASIASGIIAGTYNDVTNTLTYTIFFNGLSAPSIAAHFHAPALPGFSAPVIIPHAGFPTGVTSGVYSHTDILSDAQEAWLLNGQVYSNIHTTALPGGEIKAQLNPTVLDATTYPFVSVYRGSNEVPPNASPAIGVIYGSYNKVTNMISYTIHFRGLTANSTAAHFHAPAPPTQSAPVIIPHAGFPTGVTAGTYTHTDMLSETQEGYLMQGLMYSNIHTSTLPGGEIRAQILLGAAGDCVAPTFKNDLTIVLDASCTGNDGLISLIPTSGSAPFMYSINGGATYVDGPAAGYSFMNLAPGTYQLRLKDAGGCESAVITREVRKFYGGPLFRNDGTIVLDASCGANDGNISIIPTCGAAPFQYSLDGGVTYVEGPATGYTFQNLAAGTYQLRLKDAYGTESAIVTREVRKDYYGPCATVATARPAARGAQAKEGVATLQAYPNPSQGRFQVQLGRIKAPRIQLQVVDARGTVLQQRTLNGEQTSVVEVDLAGKAKGLYLIRVVSDKGTQQTKVLLQ